MSAPLAARFGKLALDFSWTCRQGGIGFDAELRAPPWANLKLERPILGKVASNEYGETPNLLQVRFTPQSFNGRPIGHIALASPRLGAEDNLPLQGVRFLRGAPPLAATARAETPNILRVAPQAAT